MHKGLTLGSSHNPVGSVDGKDFDCCKQQKDKCLGEACRGTLSSTSCRTGFPTFTTLAHRRISVPSPDSDLGFSTMVSILDPEPNTVIYSPSTSSITTITLNRASRRNAVDPRTAQKLYDAFSKYEADSTQKVCVFHGANGTFCAGADLQEVTKRALSENAHFGSVNGRNIAPMGPSRMQIRKPVICAVSGYAVAGGLELSLLGDMRVVEEDAMFGVFCRRFGVP